MQFEFRQALRRQRHQAGVVRARTDFGEPHGIALDEQFDAEDAASAEVAGDVACDVARFLQRGRCHRHRLPGFDIVAIHLNMTDRFAEEGFHVAGSADGAHRKLGDLVVEIDEALDDDASSADTARGLRVIPGLHHVGRGLQQRLTLARGRHDRLHHTGKTDSAIDGRLQLGERIGKLVRGGGQAELLRREPAYPFAVHGQLRGAGGGNHLCQPSLFDFHQHRGGDGLDLRHHQMRLFLLDQRAQSRAIGHGHHVAAMRHLHAGCVGIAIDADHFATQPLQCDNDLLAQFAAAQKHDARGGLRKRRADTIHDAHQVLPKKM